MSRHDPISSLRLKPEDEGDLRWFFTEADGDLGLKSTYAGMVQQLQIGGRRGTHTPVQHEPDGRLVAAATRARMISRALEVCGMRYAGVLRAAYGPLAHPELYPVLGELADLVVDTAAAQRLHRRARTTKPIAVWLARQVLRSGKGDEGALADVYAVRVEADATLTAASRAYAIQRRELLRRAARR